MPGDTQFKKAENSAHVCETPKPTCFPLHVWAPSTLESRTQGVSEAVVDTTENRRWENSELRGKEQKEKNVRNNKTNLCDIL